MILSDPWQIGPEILCITGVFFAQIDKFAKRSAAGLPERVTSTKARERESDQNEVSW